MFVLNYLLMEGNTALGASSPEKPHLHIPEPLSITSGTASESTIFNVVCELCSYLISEKE